MNDKRSFIVYKDWGADFQEMTMEERGQMITAIFAYQASGEITEFGDRFLDAVFRRYIAAFGVDSEKWQNIRGKRSEAGKKSAEARRNKTEQVEAKGTNAECVEQDGTSATVNCNMLSVNCNLLNGNDNCQCEMENEICELENENVICHPENEDEGTLVNTFAAEFGRQLKQSEINILNDWTYNFSDGLIVWALREAVLSGVKDFGYISQILSRLKYDGVTTAEDAEAQRALTL